MEIDRKVQECYSQYCEIDKYATFNDSYSLVTDSFRKIRDVANDLIKKIDQDLKSNNLNIINPQDAYLYNENSKPIPIRRDEKYQSGLKTNYVMKTNSQNSNIPIKLPQENEELQIAYLTIPKLNDYYQFYIKVIRIFPNFVSAMLSKKSPQMESEAIACFGKLLQIYKNLPEKDYSLISSTTNLFSESFVSMIGKFKKAGVNFQNILPIKCKVSDEIIQDFFQYPEKDYFYLPSNEWTAGDKKNESFNIPTLIDSFNIDDTNPQINNFPSIPPSNDEYDKPNKTENKLENKENDDKIFQLNLEFRRLMSEAASKIKEEDDGDNNKKFITTNKKNDDQNGKNDADIQIATIVDNDNVNSTEVSKTQFDGMISEFTEENGILRAVDRMSSMKKESELKNLDDKPYKPKESYLDTNRNDLPIIKLMQHSLYIANKFIATSSDIDIPQSKIAVNILVDCSSFISDENKVFNMMIICALTQALDSLGIPYSAAVVADKNFKCIIKKFDEVHSPKCLQKIFDCLLIKRFRTKLASSVKFAIDYMKFSNNNNNDNEQKEDRPYRAIFVFSDGLDEHLVLTHSWMEKVFTDENLSYGFIFIKSSKLIDKNLSIVENVWNTFENEINRNKSIVKIAQINAQINDDLLKKLTDLFIFVMNRNIIPTNEKSKIYEYADANFVIDKKLTDTSRFESFMKADYSKIKSYFIDSTQVLKNANSVNDKLDPKKYAKHLRKIISCESDIDTYEFVKEFLINRRNIDQSSLETLFKPNKANQYLLSTTGTDFDIIALVLYLINPTPEPMIYLEQTGGMIRNYAVTIVIDPSYSCFDSLSGSHSFQTIRAILSSLASLDLNNFDLIIAGNPNPTIVCSEVCTINALSNKSTLFNSLFAILQCPLRNVDLASAIHEAYNLKRMRYSDCTSILLVLTNGLYQKEECDKILNSVNICVQSGISIFGIGIGVYPKGIEKIFPQVVFSPNPSNVMKAVASFYSDSVSSLLPKMMPISFPPPTASVLFSTIKELIKSNPIFESLKGDLRDNIRLTLDAFDDMYNEEQEIVDKNGNVINPVGVNTELYVKDLLKTQKS